MLNIRSKAARVGDSYVVCKAHKIVQEFERVTGLTTGELTANTDTYYKRSEENMNPENLAAITINEYFIKSTASKQKEAAKLRKMAKMLNLFT